MARDGLAVASPTVKRSTFVLAALLAAPGVHAAHAKPPSAATFGKIFAATANAYASAHHDGRRVSNPHCVQAAPGRYMCAYLAVTPGNGAQCHLMQARWTPTLASTITVTLSGRMQRCGSVREAIRSLP
jgi:hypothetical protein